MTTFGMCVPVAHIVNNFGDEISTFRVIDIGCPVVGGMVIPCSGTPVRATPAVGVISTVYTNPAVDTRRLRTVVGLVGPEITIADSLRKPTAESRDHPSHRGLRETFVSAVR